MSDDLQKESLPLAAAEPLGGPSYPLAVAIAGMIWIVIGCLVLLYVAWSLVELLTLDVYQGGMNAAIGGGLAVVVLSLFGALLLFAGIRSIRGMVRGTLVYAIGSILVAVLYLGQVTWLQAAAGRILNSVGVGLTGVL